METSPLGINILFYLGPIPISLSVVTTWIIMAIITVVSWLGLRHAGVQAGTLQTALEIIVETLASQIKEIIRQDPWPYLPLLGTLFIFLILANLAAVVPGASPPTGHTPCIFSASAHSVCGNTCDAISSPILFYCHSMYCLRSRAPFHSWCGCSVT
jgi:F-type H+-transporting ATPase subunit a